MSPHLKTSEMKTSSLNVNPSSEDASSSPSILDALVTKIRSFIAATKCTVFAISHLNRGSSQHKNMEDGSIPELHDVRGSHSLVQLADTIWALSRKRGTNTTHSFCLKNRMLGRQGYSGSFEFNEGTQQLRQLWDDPTNHF